MITTWRGERNKKDGERGGGEGQGVVLVIIVDVLFFPTSSVLVKKNEFKQEGR